jgi:hypothetical protein
MYDGFFEKRVPNPIMKSVLESRIHLFQFGKVGSKAIESALYASGHTNLILHLHSTSDLVKHYPDCLLSYEEVLDASRDRPILFITGVRDPLQRIISGYFETFTFQCHNKSVEELCRDINRSVGTHKHIDLILNWFDHGFFSDIDVFCHDFNHDDGYSIIKKGNISVFLYKFEALPHLERQLSSFSGHALRLGRVNCASDKAYHDLYREVTRTIRFPSQTVESVIASPLVRHFYSDREINEMRDKWLSSRHAPVSA